AREPESVMVIANQRDIASACAGNGRPAALGAADWLSLSASPTFALMALLTLLGGGPMDMLCSTAHGPLGGMVPMYVLMSAFHSGPWLRLISSIRIVQPVNTLKEIPND